MVDDASREGAADVRRCSEVPRGVCLHLRSCKAVALKTVING